MKKKLEILTWNFEQPTACLSWFPGPWVKQEVGSSFLLWTTEFDELTPELENAMDEDTRIDENILECAIVPLKGEERKV